MKSVRSVRLRPDSFILLTNVLCFTGPRTLLRAFWSTSGIFGVYQHHQDLEIIRVGLFGFRGWLFLHSLLNSQQLFEQLFWLFLEQLFEQLFKCLCGTAVRTGTAVYSAVLVFLALASHFVVTV